MTTTSLSRRRFLRGALAGGAGGLLAHASCHPLGRAFALEAARGLPGRCLVLWMNGGPSQFETFDPKPGTATGGETASIGTSIPGLSIAEGLPKMAQRMDRLAVLRNLTSREGEHLRAQYLMHTGYPLVSTFPRPTLGSIVSHEFPPEPFPTCVSLGGETPGPAYLGSEHAPLAITDVDETRRLLAEVRGRSDRLQFLHDLGAEFNEEFGDERTERRGTMLSRIERMVHTPFVAALDVDRESEETRGRYGSHAFGRSCLAARRLLEAGVRFVEVQLDGWDTHQDNFAATSRLCGTLDSAWSALHDDLAASGLLDETTVLWMGEFGRTPTINGNRGRDHFAAVTSAVLGGGPIRTGQSIGETNAEGTSIVGTAHSIADLFATLLSHMGIDPASEFQTDFGSPAAATDMGTPIPALT